MDDLAKEITWQPTASTTSPTLRCSVVDNVTKCDDGRDFLDSNSTQDSAMAGDDLDTTKVVVLTSIIVFTVLGNVAVILAIICRKMKMNRYLGPIL